MMAVMQGEKFGLRRYNSRSGRKSPIFDTFRPPDTENFRQGLQASQRRSIFRTWDPWILVVPLWLCLHAGDMHGLSLVQTRLAGIAKEGGMLFVSLTKPSCALSLISNGDVYLII